MARFETITKGTGVVIQRWLQALPLAHQDLPKYIEAQVLTAKNKGGIGFLFWNAANDYGKAYVAMPEMSAVKWQYFVGMKHPGTVQASLTPSELNQSERTR
jgi:hypothetical protein